MRCRVLIVDDRPANLVALEALLADTYDIVKACSGHEALEFLARATADVVLLDIEMPELDGYETTRRIKELPNGRDLPVILISGVFTEDPFVKKGYESGAVDYFTKPFDTRVLRAKLEIYASMGLKNAVIREQAARIAALELTLADRDGVPRS